MIEKRTVVNRQDHSASLHCTITPIRASDYRYCRVGAQYCRLDKRVSFIIKPTCKKYYCNSCLKTVANYPKIEINTRRKLLQDDGYYNMTWNNTQAIFYPGTTRAREAAGVCLLHKLTGLQIVSSVGKEDKCQVINHRRTVDDDISMLVSYRVNKTSSIIQTHKYNRRALVAAVKLYESIQIQLK